MQIDIGNATTEVADFGLSRSDLESLDSDVRDAHEMIEANRERGEFGYTSLNLPTNTSPERIHQAVEPLQDSESVLTIGIGGSALGALTISRALGANHDEHYVLDNVDPAYTGELLDSLDFNRTAVNVVSRSGTTAETLANFLLIRERMENSGVDWTKRTIVTTGSEGPLRELVTEHDLPVLSVPEGVPGRFSALSSVGLVPAAILDLDIETVLHGGKSAANSLEPSLFDCPAYAYGAVSYALAKRGAETTVMMPYAEGLEAFAEWFAQLWAESLGKDGIGQTPVRALGATDQHSQLQLYRAGPKDKLVTFVRPTDRRRLEIPETSIPDLAYLSETDLGSVLDAEFDATEASLAAAGVPNIRMELERLDAHGIGELLYTMEAACIMAGELFDVETFTQPAVEWGKRAARGLLGDDEFEEADAVTEKHRFVVE